MFRPEVVRSPNETAVGNVRLTSSRLINALVLALMTAGAGALLATLGMSYSRTTLAPAWATPSGSLVTVPALASGVVVKVVVREGDAVRQGDALVVVSSDRIASRGPALASAMQDLEQRDARLVEQLSFVDQRRATRPSEHARLRASIERSRAISAGEIELLQRRIELAETAVQQSVDLQREGFVTSHAARERREAVIDLRLRLEVAKKDAARVERELEESDEALTRSRREDDIERSRLQQQRLQLAVETKRAAIEREQIVVSPEAGVVTAMPVRAGDFVAPGQSIVTVLSAALSPAGHDTLPLVAWMPSRDMEEISPGAVAWVSYEPYATQRYGRQRAIVTGVSQTPINPADLPPGRRASLFAGRPEEPLYRVDLSTSRNWRGGIRPAPMITPGMGARIEIVQTRRRVVDSLLEPLRRLDPSRND
jgi:membrane fusion protein